MSDLHCEDVLRLWLDRAEGNPLSPGEQSAVADHLAECERCRIDSSVARAMHLDGPPGPAPFAPRDGSRTAFVERTLDLAAASAIAPGERLGGVVSPAGRPLPLGARIGLIAGLAAGLILILGAISFFWVRTGEPEPAPEQQPVAEPRTPAEQVLQPEERSVPEPLLDEDDALATTVKQVDTDSVVKQLSAELEEQLGQVGGRDVLAPPAPSKTKGRLNVNSNPWSEVFVDGAKIGNTPIVGRELPAGVHEVKLWVPASGLEKTYKVDIKAGASTTLVKNLKGESAASVAGPPGRLSVQTKPWCTVYIDGRKVKNTPLVNYPLKPGTYSVTVENPTYDIRQTYRVKIKSDDTTTLVKDLF